MDPRMAMMMGQKMGSMGGSGGGGSNAMSGSGGYPNFWAGFPGMMQGLFGDSGAPFKKATEAFQPYYQESKGYQQPFQEMGHNAMGQFQDWLGQQKDPSGFMNHLMGQYQESPYAKYQQQQSMRAAQNMGSATGLTGSTPLTQYAQQNARDISSQDMGSWLERVLGINTQYGQGLSGEMGMGQHANDMLSELASNAGNTMGQAAYGREAGSQQDSNALWGGIAKLFGG